MTEFQKYCEKKLVYRLQQYGLKIEQRRVAENDAYITGLADEYQFWIYDDGADFRSTWYGKSFEKYDYESLEDLADIFCDNLAMAILEKDVLKEKESHRGIVGFLKKQLGKGSDRV